jgi:glycosyltransferase involved in cell wall biosynthesis
VRVVHFGSTAQESTNGVHRATGTLARMAARNGHEVHVVGFSRSLDHATTEASDGVTHHKLPVYGPARLGSHAQWMPPATRDQLQDLAGDGDVLHLHSVFQVDHLWARALNVPFILCPHGGYAGVADSRQFSLGKRLWFHAFDRQLLKTAGVVQALTRREALRLDSLVPGSRTVTLPIPIECPPALRGKWAGTSENIVFLGRLDIQHKGLDLLLQAYARSRAPHEGRRLVLAGPGDAKTIDRIVGTIRDEGITAHVDLPGVVTGDEKWDLLMNAGCFVHPSRWEGLPISVIEAAGIGVPLLVSTETNLADEVLTARAGVVCNPSVESIVRGLDALTPRQAAGQYSVGSTRLGEKYSEGRLQQRYFDLYEKVAR